MTVSQNRHSRVEGCRTPNQALDTNKKDDPLCQDWVEADFDLEIFPIRKVFTLIFIHDKSHEQLLLGQKQRGPLLGQWNGFGGKVERGLDESIAQSAARELEEEAFIRAPLFPIGFIQWVVESGREASVEEPTYRDIMVVYKGFSIESVINTSPEACFSPIPTLPAPCIPSTSSVELTQARFTEFKPSDEMAPAWWPIEQLPWESMRINHKVWYPFLLADRPFRGVYWYETRITFPGDEGQGEELAQKHTLRKNNAQRENAKEIWIEALHKRRFQFGERPLHTSMDRYQDWNRHVDREMDKEEQTFHHGVLESYTARLGLADPSYATGLAKHQDQVSFPVDCGGGPYPTPSKIIDEKWLESAIADAEHDWMLQRL